MISTSPTFDFLVTPEIWHHFKKECGYCLFLPDIELIDWCLEHQNGHVSAYRQADNRFLCDLRDYAWRKTLPETSYRLLDHIQTQLTNLSTKVDNLTASAPNKAPKAPKAPNTPKEIKEEPLFFQIQTLKGSVLCTSFDEVQTVCSNPDSPLVVFITKSRSLHPFRIFDKKGELRKFLTYLWVNNTTPNLLEYLHVTNDVDTLEQRIFDFVNYCVGATSDSKDVIISNIDTQIPATWSLDEVLDFSNVFEERGFYFLPGKQRSAPSKGIDFLMQTLSQEGTLSNYDISFHQPSIEVKEGKYALRFYSETKSYHFPPNLDADTINTFLQVFYQTPAILPFVVTNTLNTLEERITDFKTRYIGADKRSVIVALKKREKVTEKPCIQGLSWHAFTWWNDIIEVELDGHSHYFLRH